MEVSEIRVLYMENPLGIDRRPWFSWKLKSAGENTLQTAYRVCVREEDSEREIWDSGRVESRRNLYVDFEGEELSSRTRYRVKVSAWDNHGNQAEADAQFETAFLKRTDWRARWVVSTASRGKRKKGFGKQPPATMFRKAFVLKEKPVRARVYATCYGIYELSVNGKHADGRLFAPEHTVYGKYLCYQTYDVTDLLEQGENVLGMYVADGWYLGPNTLPNMKKPVLKHAALFQLEAVYADGTAETICSDEETENACGPVVCADLFAGEMYDANKICLNWDTPAYPAGQWKKAATEDFGYENLVAQLGEPVTRERVIPAKSVSLSPKGEWILDFGQVIAGVVRMKVSAPKGTEIILEHTEVLDKDGNYISNIMAAGGTGKGVDQKDVYISDGKERIFEPSFTYHGFRYVRVSGLTAVQAEDFSAVVFSTEKRNLGTFETSDARLNRLYENTRWSQRANMLSIPTDCPQREKAGWTGDMLVYARTALLNEDCRAMFSRWLENMALDQEENGVVPMVVPNDGPYPMTGKMMNLMYHEKGQATSSGWGDAAVIVPYRMYEVTGDTAVLRQQFSSMKKWCDYIIQKAASAKPKGSTLPDGIENYLWDTGYHYGEWLIPSQNKNGLDMKNLGAIMAASACYTAPIFGWLSVSTFSEICGILAERYPADGDRYQKAREKYASVAKRMKNAIQKGVIREDGSMPSDLMGAYVLPIYFDLVPGEWKETFAKRLVNSIREHDGCMDTGFLGTPFLLDALCRIGRRDLADALLWQEKAPSWLSEVDAGATTIWENCFGYDADGNPGQLSFNHYSFGCVDDWMFRYIGGIRAGAPGFEHIIFAPEPDARLDWAKRTYETPQGKASCQWKKEKTDLGIKFSLKVEIPCNSTAEIRLPDGSVRERGSGTYEFCCMLEK